MLSRAILFTLAMLFLLAGCASQKQPINSPSIPQRFVITDYGAVGDGKTLNTQAFQKTIEKCASSGGGVLVVPAGTFMTGAIFFKQGVNLTVEKDGVLKGSAEQKDYPQVQTRWEGIERVWTSALVNFVDQTNVRIDGQGTIDGSGDLWVQRSPPGRGPRGTGRRGTTQPQTRPSQASAATNPIQRGPGRPRLICIQNCRSVRVSNLNFRNQAVWCLHILYCEDVVAENLVIRAAHDIPSSDGMDIDSSRRVLVTGCDIDCNDDCISIKSGRDADGLRVNRPSEEIVIEKTRLAYGHGGVAMGSETSGGIRNVEVRNCVSEAGNFAPIRFKTQPSRGGVVENITYRDIALHDTRQAFEFNMEWRMVPPIAPPSAILPVFRNVRIINVTGTVSRVGVIHGIPGSPIQNIQFENVKLSAQRGLSVDNVQGTDFSGLSLDVQQGPPIVDRTAAATTQTAAEPNP